MIRIEIFSRIVNAKQGIFRKEITKSADNANPLAKPAKFPIPNVHHVYQNNIGIPTPVTV